jgi:hypothetical protein
MGKLPRSKYQHPNNLQVSMTKFKSKKENAFGHLKLDIGIYLQLEI